MRTDRVVCALWMKCAAYGMQAGDVAASKLGTGGRGQVSEVCGIRCLQDAVCDILGYVVRAV